MSSRPDAMTLLFAMIAIGVQSPAITIKFPPTKMAEAMKLLSDASGKKLAAAPNFSDEVVVARIRSGNLDQALGHLAEAFYAKWRTESDGTLLLVKDLDAMKRHEKELDDAKAQMLAGSMEYLRKRLGEQPAELDERAIRSYRAKLESEEIARKKAEEAKDYDHMFLSSSAAEETPAWRATARLMLLLDRKWLQSLPANSRDVFAEKPTPMQRSFPSGCADVLTQYRRELKLLDPSLDVVRVRLILNKWEFTNSFNVTFQGLDEKGNLVNQGGARLNNDSEQLKIPFSTRSRLPILPGEKPIEIPADATEIRNVLSRESKARNRSDLVVKWKPRILDPVKFEPTGWHLGTDFLEAAEAADKNLIGSVPDHIAAGYSKLETLTPSQVLQKNSANLILEKDGWLVARPADEVSRSSRSKGRQLLLDSVHDGGISIDAAATWAAGTPDRYPFVSWVGDYLNVLFPNSGPYGAGATLDETSLRLWDSLGSTARQSLRRGQTMDLNNLPSAAGEQLKRLVYWFEALDDNSIDPTERLPNGISGGTVSLTLTTRPVFLSWSSKAGPTLDPMPLDSKMLGRALARGNSYWEIPAETYQSYDRYRMGVNRTYEIRFILEPGAVPMTIRLAETLFDPASPTLDKLPQELADQVEKVRQETLAQPVAPPPKTVIPPRATRPRH